MAQPAGLTKTYDLAGIREDLEDMIYDISPMDTVFMTSIERGSATSTLHEWQTDSLAAFSRTNAALEGDDFSATTAAATTRLKNYCQISKKEVVVSGTSDAVRKAGRSKELAYQVLKRGKELKRDIEAALLSNNAATAGAAASARLAAGAETWIYHTQSIKASGNTTGTTPAPSSGVAGTAPTDGTATVTVTETLLRSALQVAWENGGETDMILLSAKQKNYVDGFTGIATRYRDVASKSQAQIVGSADVYVSSYGPHQIRLSRYMRDRTILCLDTSMWGVAYLRPFQTIDIAKTGDSEKKMVLAEYTLVCKNPLASTKLQDMATS